MADYEPRKSEIVYVVIALGGPGETVTQEDIDTVKAMVERNVGFKAHAIEDRATNRRISMYFISRMPDAAA
jgi:hypothetical protein